MLHYFLLRPAQQLFCGVYGLALAVFLAALLSLFGSISVLLFFSLFMLSVALFWGGLGLYARHTDRVRSMMVSPAVALRSGTTVVLTLPRHEKARYEWMVLQDDAVFVQQTVDLLNLIKRFVWRGVLSAPAVILALVACLVWCLPEEGAQVVTQLRNAEPEYLVYMAGGLLKFALVVSALAWLMTELIADTFLPNSFRRVLLARAMEAHKGIVMRSRR